MSVPDRWITLEVCVQGIDSALAAQEGGADRIELCEDLAVGGVTPSAGAIGVACARLSIPVHVLIRPRGGDFVYSEAELEVMERDVATARDLGAAGVVLGILDAAGNVDRNRTARLIARARPLAVTFHKAFDAAADLDAALDDLFALGVDRVLTSGCAATAREGLETLARLVRRASGRLAVMAGGRVGMTDIHGLAAAGLTEIHVGSAAQQAGRTDPVAVRALVAATRVRTA